MLIDKTTNTTYNDRQEAKKVLGHSVFNKKVKRGEIEYIVSTHNASDVIL